MTLMVMVERALIGMVVGEKDFVIRGACAVTVRMAVEVFPAPPSVEVTVVLLTFVPTEVPVTITEMLH